MSACITMDQIILCSSLFPHPLLVYSEHVQVCVVDQRVGAGVGGGAGWEREVTAAQESAEGGCVANATAAVTL